MRTASRPMAAFSLIVAASLALTACGGDADAEAEAGNAEAGTVTFAWDRNLNAGDEKAEPEFEKTEVEVPKNPENIVVFDMASLDTIGALGGEVSGAPLESVPDYLEKYLADDAYNVGTLFEADVVAVEAEQPDLIIIAGRSAALFEDLNEIAPTVDLSLRGSYSETLERNATFLGEVLGAEDEAAAAIEEIEKGLEEAKAATADAGTGLGLMVAGGELSAMAPAGKGSDARAARGGLIYDAFGVEPAIEDIKAATHGEPVSFEFLLETNPDYLWVVDRDAATGEGTQSAEAVLDNDIVKQTTAAKKGQIVYLDPVAWYVVFGGIDTTKIMIDDVLQIAG